MQGLLTFSSDTLSIRPWVDDLIDALGHDPRSHYVEQFWLPVLGPSTTWLVRRLAAGFDESPEGFELPLAETAHSLGLGDRAGRNSPFLRSINRTIQFGVARATGEVELSVRRRLPPLARRQLAHVSPSLASAHDRFQRQMLEDTPAEAQRRRAYQLALSLAELGNRREEAESQLLRWRYHPALARKAAEWAYDQRDHTPAGVPV